MAKPKRRLSVDDRLALLDEKLAQAESTAASELLRAALDDSNASVVRKAAKLAAEQLCYELITALTAAFVRLSDDDPAKHDPNCIGKAAIAKALLELDYLDVDFFRRGLRYRQLEPVWGGSVDTAVEVRCHCAMGLAASGYPRALVDLAELLADEAAAARQAAVQAIALLAPLPSEALLRHKVLIGDDDPLVTSECFSALLGLEPDESVTFVAGFLDDKDTTLAGLAALALGESRLPAALAPLTAAWRRHQVQRGLSANILSALALHRSAEAVELLLSVVKDAHLSTAATAATALLEVNPGNSMRAQLSQALAQRPGQPLTLKQLLKKSPA